jgi:hypothetical protein
VSKKKKQKRKQPDVMLPNLYGMDFKEGLRALLKTPLPDKSKIIAGRVKRKAEEKKKKAMGRARKDPTINAIFIAERDKGVSNQDSTQST